MNVAFRVDASEFMGFGHVARCLTLADELKKRGGEIIFISQSLPEHLEEQICRGGHDLINLEPSERMKSLKASQGDDPDSVMRDAGATGAVLRARHSEILVVDHYGLDSFWEKAVKPTTRKLVVIDDLANREHEADLLIDPTYDETEVRYRNLVPSWCRMHCGSQYALLRPQFHKQRFLLNNRPLRTPPTTVHVFFGGSDPENHTAKISRILLAEMEVLKIHAVVGQGFGFQTDLEQLASGFPGRFLWETGVDNMAAHMSACDIALGAPGGATWERACLGLPSLYFAVSQNQVVILKHLEAAGLCVYGGEVQSTRKRELLSLMKRFLSDAQRLAQMRNVGMRAVDGQGVVRIADLLEKLL